MGNRASVDAVSKILAKVLIEGRLNRIPRHPEQRDVVLAILCLGLRRRHPYSEAELNEFLESALIEIRARVDHVTCRRYMVDLGFLKRDRAGSRYFLNYPKVETVLSEEAMASSPDLVRKRLANVPSVRPLAEKYE